jgi:hypothetical protein
LFAFRWKLGVVSFNEHALIKPEVTVHDKTHLQIVNEEGCLQVQRAVANVFNKQYRTADNRSCFRLGVDLEPKEEEEETKRYEVSNVPRTWTSPLY